MPRNGAAVSKDVREVIEAAYEGARADLGERLAQEEVDRQALVDGVRNVRRAITAMLQQDQPDHPVLAIRDDREFFDRIHRAFTLRDKFLNKAVLALLECVDEAVRNVGVLNEALAPLDGRALHGKRRGAKKGNGVAEDGEDSDSGDTLTAGRYGRRRGEIRDAIWGELKKWVAGGETERFTNSAEFHARIGCDDRTGRRVLDWLAEQGFLEQHGKGAGTHYTLTAKGKRELSQQRPDGQVRTAVRA